MAHIHNVPSLKQLKRKEQIRRKLLDNFKHASTLPAHMYHSLQKRKNLANTIITFTFVIDGMQLGQSRFIMISLSHTQHSV